MSKIKTPQEKKLASLELDARNVYGENDKASRKLIPRRKQESHQAARRAAKQPLLHIAKESTEEDFVNAEFDVLTQEIAGKRTGFRKEPDESLGTVLEVKQTGDHTLFKRYRKYR
jgi:hypothetical protein